MSLRDQVRYAVTPAPLASRPAWAQMLISLSPLSLVLVVYAVAQWVSAPISVGPVEEGSPNRLGFGLHIDAPAMLDRAVFGSVPTVVLQDAWAGSSATWLDAVCALVYVTHYVALPVVTLVVWFCHREAFRAWIQAVVVLTAVGVATYVLFPAAPPWLAADRGVVEPIRRLSAIGWDRLHLGVVGDLVTATQAGSNPVAAMPSLHAAVPVLLAGFLWNRQPRWRAGLACYAVVMAVVLVYTGEHYVVDVAAGWLVGAAACVAAHLLRGDAVTADRTA